MKKVLLIVLLLLSCGKAMALENEVKITNRKFKYYKINKVWGDYKTLDEENLFDLNDYKKTELSSLSPIKPISKNDRKIYEYNGFHYLKALKVNKIQFIPFNSCSISNITISNNNDILVNKNEKYDVISDPISFSLNSEYDLENLYFSFKTGDNDEQIFTINFMHDDTILTSVGTMAAGNVSMFYAGKNYDLYENSFTDIYSINEMETSKYLKFKENIKLYNYEDYKYHSYKTEKEYYPDYLSEPFEEYIYKDENDYIDEIIENSYDNKIIINENINEQSSTKDIIINENKPNNKSIPLSKNENLKEIYKTPEITSNKQTYNNSYQEILKIKSKENKVKNKSTKYVFISFLIILLLLFIKIKRNLKSYI